MSTYFGQRASLSAFFVFLGLIVASCGSSGQPNSEGRDPSFIRMPYSTDALIYDGTAAAFGDADAIAEIARSQGLTYRRVTSAELDSMSVDEIADYGVILWPGGYAGQQSASLDRSTRDRIRQAVRERGTGFVGFCAGAFIAVSPATDWGFSLVQAETLPYYHLEDEGTPSAMVEVELPGGEKKNLVWWGGPKMVQPGATVLARYTDTGEGAISEQWVGNGLVILSGPHPEAPSEWRQQLGLSDSDGVAGDQAYAGVLILAALKGTPVSHN